MIREIDSSEIPACADVIRRSFLSVAQEFGFTPENAPRFTAFAMTEDRLRRQLEQERRLMCAYRTDDGEIIGYYSLLLPGDGTCELNNLCVLPAYRHGHIGASLLSDARRRAKSAGCTLMRIGIVEENKRLRAWYEANGFVHTGTEKYDFFPFTCGYMETKL